MIKYIFTNIECSRFDMTSILEQYQQNGWEVFNIQLIPGTYPSYVDRMNIICRKPTETVKYTNYVGGWRG